jgi:hypothetical protein
VSPQEFLVRTRNVLGGQDDSTLVILIVVAVAITAVVILFMYLARLATPAGRARALLDDRSRGGGRGVWVPRLVAVGVLLAGLFMAGWYLQRPQTCASCHTDGAHTETLAESAHVETSCMSCHRPPGVSGYAEAGLAYARWLGTYAVVREVPESDGATGVDNGSCLRCHRDIAAGTIEARGIRVRHSDFLDEGARCADCHGATAHGQSSSVPTEPKMDDCFPCHDGERASSECETCHIDDIAVTAFPEEFPAVETVAAGESCYECHAEGPCVSCHGVTMPHPADWSDPEAGGRGTHAREGFANRDVCFRCHYAPGQQFVASDESCSCHGLLGKMHGGEAWVAEHGLQATGQKPGQYSDCFTCHSNSLCDQCHPPSYRGMWAPRGGPDLYQRDIPEDPFYFDY